MRIRRYVNPQLFLAHNQEWLLRSELQNSTMLAVLHLLSKDNHPFKAPYYLATIETDAGIAGCAVGAAPDPLILSDVPIEAIPLLVADIATVYEMFPGVTGTENVATAFAKQWQREFGGSWAINHWRWYRLEPHIMRRKLTSGRLRLAGPSDLDLVRSWAPHFARETGTSVDVITFYERRIRTGSLYLWHDEVPRSLVAVSGVTPNSIRLSAVYTDPDSRRNGYATAAVASVSQKMFDAGHQFCLLFADTSDPFANRLYSNIGYRPIFDKVNICSIPLTKKRTKRQLSSTSKTRSE